MICDNGDGVQGLLKVMFPFEEGKDDSEEFPVIDVIVLLSKREGL